MWEILLLLISCDAVIPNIECEEELQKEIAFATSEDITYSKMVLYSGLRPNTLGSYRQCNDIKIAKYAVYEIEPTVLITACIPKVCSKEDLAYSINNGILSGVLDETTGPISADNIHFPQDYYEENCTTLGTGAIVMISFISIIASVALMATAYDVLVISSVTLSWTADGTNDHLLENDHSRANFTQKLVLCFSLYSNFQKLFESRAAERLGKRDTLDILNGIRVMSIGWVVLAHTGFICVYYGVLSNYEEIPDILTSSNFILIYAAEYSVDTFFWLSGMLVAYLFLTDLNSSEGMSTAGWAHFYVHRYIRLTPVFLFCTLFWWCMQPYFGNGPFWYQNEEMIIDCNDYWWANAIYMNNMILDYKGSYCLPQAWYLANDMQFFLVSPIILYIHKKQKLIGWIAICFLINLSILSSGFVAYHYDLKAAPLVEDSNDQFTRYYNKPYTRVGPYAMGLAVGILVYSYKIYKKSGKKYDSISIFIANILNSKPVRYIFLALGNAMVAFFTFILYSNGKDTNYENYENWNQHENIVYYAFSRNAFIFGLSLIMLPCLLGHFKYLAMFLGSSVWSPLARMNYSLYLMHFNIVYIVYKSQKIQIYFSEYNLIRDFAFFWILGLVISLLVVLLIEYPCMNLEKLFLKKPVVEKRVVDIDTGISLAKL